MISIAVVEDEELIRNQLVNLIREQLAVLTRKDGGTYLKGEYSVEIYSSGEEYLSSGKEYDVIIMDIQMPGLSGIETAEKMRSRGTDRSLVIFVTGIREHVFTAFDVGAFHYLLKPIDEEKFAQVLKRALEEIEKRLRQEELWVFVKTKDRNRTMKQKEILYIESRGKKVEIHTGKEIVVAYGAMRGLEEQLGECFYRCHRGYLVNMAYIAEYGRDNIVLNNGEEILLAKEKYGEFVKVYMRYLKRGGTIYV